jgi:hypothetical protein
MRHRVRLSGIGELWIPILPAADSRWRRLSSRYVDDPARFAALRDSLTEALALALVGLKINDRAQVARAAAAATLDDVARLAGRLQTELR